MASEASYCVIIKPKVGQTVSISSVTPTLWPEDRTIGQCVFTSGCWTKLRSIRAFSSNAYSLIVERIEL